MLYLCDNQALLKSVRKGGKATSVGAPDAEILFEAIEGLRKRTTAAAGAATFLVKVATRRTCEQRRRYL